jgi:hypothetical protein
MTKPSVSICGCRNHAPPALPALAGTALKCKPATPTAPAPPPPPFLTKNTTRVAQENSFRYAVQYRDNLNWFFYTDIKPSIVYEAAKVYDLTGDFPDPIKIRS